MSKKLFLSWKEFWDHVGAKRSKSGALSDIHMMEFDEMYFDFDSNEYVVDIRMKDNYRKGYMVNKYLVDHNLVIMENIHLIHWAEWLNIGVIGETFPNLSDRFMLVTRVDLVLDEPTFVDQRIRYRMKVLAERHKKKKHEYVFLNMIGDWARITIEYCIVDEQFAILEHYHQKHSKKQTEAQDMLAKHL